MLNLVKKAFSFAVAATPLGHIQNVENTTTTSSKIHFQPFKQQLNLKKHGTIDIELQSPIIVKKDELDKNARCDLQLVITNNTNQEINRCDEITIFTTKKKGKDPAFGAIKVSFYESKSLKKKESRLFTFKNQHFEDADKNDFVQYTTFKGDYIKELQQSTLRLHTTAKFWQDGNFEPLFGKEDPWITYDKYFPATFAKEEAKRKEEEKKAAQKRKAQLEKERKKQEEEERLEKAAAARKKEEKEQQQAQLLAQQQQKTKQEEERKKQQKKEEEAKKTPQKNKQDQEDSEDPKEEEQKRNQPKKQKPIHIKNGNSGSILLPLFLISIPGTIAYLLYTHYIPPTTTTDEETDLTDQEDDDEEDEACEEEEEEAE